MTDRQLVIKIAIEMARLDNKWIFTEDAVPVVGTPKNPRVAWFVQMAQVAVDMVKQEQNDRLSKSSRSVK